MSNSKLHSVDFALAAQLEWEAARYLPDVRQNYAEGRIVGFAVFEFRLYVIVFTLRKSGLRIISLRKANDREIDRYEQAIETSAEQP